MDDQLKDMNLEDSHEKTTVGTAETAQSQDNQDTKKDEPVTAAPKSESDDLLKEKSETADSGSNNSVARYGQTTKLSDMVPKVSEKPRHQIRTMQDREISMILKTQGRAISQALMSIAGTKQRSSRLLLTAGAMFLVIALLIIQVYYRHREINLGYELSAAISEREALLEENRKLRIELRVQSLRENLEQKAGKQLGVSTIRNDQVLLYDMKGKTNLRPLSSKKRMDGLDNVRRIGEE